MAVPAATSTAVANALPPPPTTMMLTPMTTPMTSFVKRNLIYYYLFIYHYVDRAKVQAVGVSERHFVLKRLNLC